MIEHPILFSGEMVRAILDGRKTQTRRVVRPQPEIRDGLVYDMRCAGSEAFFRREPWHYATPGYRPGHRLWVREAHYLQWGAHNPWPDLPSIAVEPIGAPAQRCYYREGFDRVAPHWRSSIHMPRWASRIMLEVIAVRVEELWEITEDDERAEGVDSAPFDGVFEALWDRINARRGYPWESNPWVWVIEFRRCDR